MFVNASGRLEIDEILDILFLTRTRCLNTPTTENVKEHAGAGFMTKNEIVNRDGDHSIKK